MKDFGKLDRLFQKLQAKSQEGVQGPYILAHPRATAASVLLVHGLKGSPKQMLPLSQAFYKSGHNTLSVRLTGHCTRPENLLEVSYTDWLFDLSEGFEAALELGEKTILCGYSMGGVLALAAALSHPEQVAGVILLSPSLICQDKRMGLLPYLHPILSPFKTWVEPNAKNLIENDPDSYQKTPLHAVSEYAKLARDIRTLLRPGSIQCPVLAIFSEDDEIVAINPTIEALMVAATGTSSEILKLKTIHSESSPHKMKHSDILNPKANPFMGEMIACIEEFVSTLIPNQAGLSRAPVKTGSIDLKSLPTIGA